MSERCPNCGGLVTPGAEWCGQCFARLGDVEPETPPPAEAAALLGELAAPTEPEAPAGPGAPPSTEEERPALETGPAVEASPFQVREDGLVWTCSVCEAENPLEAQMCTRCGTPFRSLFEEGRAAPEVDPGRATALSLILPGLGHIAAGRKLEGTARILIFAWLLGTLVVIVASRAGRGLGPLLGLAVVYFAAAGGLYLVSALDARRAAEGNDPVLSSRILLYGVSALLLFTIILLFVTGPSLAG